MYCINLSPFIVNKWGKNMKVIIREYGLAVIALLTAGLLLGFGLGVIGVPTGVMDIFANNKALLAEENAGIDEEVQVYRSLSERKRPVITFQEQVAVTADVTIDWQQLFRAIDAEQNELVVEVVAVNKNKELPEEFSFACSGIYEVEVMATDEYGISVSQTFRVPVQRSLIRKGEKH